MENICSKKILIIEDNSKNVEIIKEYMKNFNVRNCIANGETALKEIEQFRPDIIITDLILQEFDGITLLEKINEISDYEPTVIVASALTHETFITRSLELGAKYFVGKPYNAIQLCKRVLELMNPVNTNANIEKKAEQNKVNRDKKILDEKISNIFISVGIPPHIKGYNYLREAIKMAVDTPEIINNITKKLYPSIAEKHDTSPSKVERAIRHAIEVAWNRGRIENINALFGIKVYSDNDKPTNGEFIALLADKLLLEAHS